MSAAPQYKKYEKKKQTHESDVAAIRTEVIGLVSVGEFNKAIHVLKKFSEKDRDEMNGGLIYSKR